MFFLFDQFAGVGQSGSHVGFCHPVLVSDLFDGHPAGQSPNKPHNRDPRATDDRLAMLHGCIDANALSHPLSLQDGFLHRTEEIHKSQFRRKGFDWLGDHLSSIGLRRAANILHNFATRLPRLG